MTRAMPSVAPPGVKGTITRTAPREGQGSCARAGAASNGAAATPESRLRRFILVPSRLDCVG